MMGFCRTQYPRRTQKKKRFVLYSSVRCKYLAKFNLIRQCICNLSETPLIIWGKNRDETIMNLYLHSSRQRRREQRAKAGVSPRRTAKKDAPVQVDQSTNTPARESRGLPPLPTDVITESKSEEQMTVGKLLLCMKHDNAKTYFCFLPQILSFVVSKPHLQCFIWGSYDVFRFSRKKNYTPSSGKNYFSKLKCAS